MISAVLCLLLLMLPKSPYPESKGTGKGLGMLFAEAYSYSMPGTWINASQPEDLNHKLRDQFLLVFGNHTWSSVGGLHTGTGTGTGTLLPVPYDSQSACRVLEEKGIEDIYFYGDSYMRQLYAATVITLTGNYRNGSISSSDWAKASGGGSCQFHSQFNEKHCGINQLDEDAIVCGSRIKLHHMHHSGYNIDSCRTRVRGNNSSQNRAINIFSTGNHKIASGHGGRYGVNDAPLHIDLFNRGFCSTLKNEADDLKKARGSTNATGVFDIKSAGCSNWWMSTHHRIIGWYPDEKGPATKAFNEGMRDFFDSGGCGAYNYIDVYNMTQALVETFTLDAGNEENKQKSMSVSYDYVHYGMEINLIKAQIVIDAWAKGIENTPSVQRKQRRHVRVR